MRRMKFTSVAILFSLMVGGGVKAKQDVWSDDVFSKDYHLMSLSELDRFIQNNHHLPDVPTEAEVKQNGVNLAAMNAVLLRKVEELTIHVIEMRKELDRMKKNQ